MKRVPRAAMRLGPVSLALLAWTHGAHAADVPTLPAVKVEDARATEKADGPVRGYVAKRSASATKTDTPLVETAQSISVITRDRLEAQSVVSVQDALRYTAGARAEPYGLDNRGDWAQLRGASFTQYQDGLRMLFGSYNNIRPDVYTLERVEVLRGPSSIMYGQGSFGGTVNLVSKRPLAEAQHEVQAVVGNNGLKRLAVDSTGPLDSEGKWLYRLVAVGQDAETQVDHTQDDRMVFMPSLTWRPNTDTELTVWANLQRDHTNTTQFFFPHQGTVLPAPNGRIPFRTNISEPGFDRYIGEQQAFGYRFEHRFNEALTLRQNVRHSDSQVTYQSIYSRFGPAPALNPDGRTLNRTIYVSKPEVEALTADTQLQANFTHGPFEHTVLFGFDFQRVLTSSVMGRGNAPAIDVYAPVYGNYTVPALARQPDTQLYQSGFYLQEQLKIDRRWIATIGARRDWARQNNDLDATSARIDAHATTWRAGLLHLFDNGWAPYVSYSESFNPSAGFNFYNEAYKPLEGEQWEVGVKYQPPGSRLFLTLAAYELKEKNRLTADPNNALNRIQVGEATIRGVEAEAQASLAGGVDLIATYTYTDSEITQSNAADLGKRLASIPEHMASGWAVKRFTAFDLPGQFEVGGGVRYIGASWDGTDSLRTPSITLMDALLAYRTGQWRYALNVDNIADREYYTTCLSRGDCFLGTLRTVRASATYRF